MTDSSIVFSGIISKICTLFLQAKFGHGNVLHPLSQANPLIFGAHLQVQRLIRHKCCNIRHICCFRNLLNIQEMPRLSNNVFTILLLKYFFFNLNYQNQMRAIQLLHLSYAISFWPALVNKALHGRLSKAHFILRLFRTLEILYCIYKKDFELSNESCIY